MNSSDTSNKEDFARVLVFDKWLGNCDSRQAVFTKGYCFNAEQWSFPDLPLHGVYYQNHVYAGVRSWRLFQPTLSSIEMMDHLDIWRCAAAIPHDWFEHDGEGLYVLVEALHHRRSLVRNLITAFRHSSRNPFPQWAAHVPIPRTNGVVKEEKAWPDLVFGESAH